VAGRTFTLPQHSFKRAERLRLALASTVFVTLLPLIGLSRHDLTARHLTGRHRLAQRYALPPPSALRTISFGFNEVAADLLWVQTIGYFAEHLTTDRDMRYLGRHLDNVIMLDPRHEAACHYGASMMTSIPSGNKAVFKAIDLLKRAHRIAPKKWSYPLSIGVLYMSELQSRDKKRRDAWRVHGADWIHRAVLLGARAPWLASLSANLLTAAGKREMAIHRLKEAYLVASNDEVRRQIAQKLRHMKLKSLSEELKAAQQSFRARYSKNPLRCVSPTLFLLIEPTYHR
jgi:hypothetical protein